MQNCKNAKMQNQIEKNASVDDALEREIFLRLL